MGDFIIDTFEPNVKNRMRYCESLSLNRWTQTEFDPPEVLAHAALTGTVDNTGAKSKKQPINNLYPYGVGKEEGTLFFQEHSNPGQGQVVTGKPGDSNSDPNRSVNTPTEIQIISLDAFAEERGWFETKPYIAVFKVDVEGYEYSVIEGMKKLLQSHLIRNIFMEISTRTEAEAASNIPLLKFLSKDCNYKLYKIGGWNGPSGDPIAWPSEVTDDNDAFVQNILDKSNAENAKQLNLWWTLP